MQGQVSSSGSPGIDVEVEEGTGGISYLLRATVIEMRMEEEGDERKKAESLFLRGEA